MGGGVSMKQTLVDSAQGPFKQTDVPTHVAIDGDGFFKVQRDGETLLTRAGNFLFRNGRLETPHGDPVLAESGGFVTVDPARPFSISTTGEVRQGDSATLLALAKRA